eukprot:COSAG01_NODE_41147_length_455_cov_0.966292_1_plen_46_part_00
MLIFLELVAGCDARGVHRMGWLATAVCERDAGRGAGEGAKEAGDA